MIDIFKTLRLALYVIALPLAVTAVVSAESLFSTQDGIIDDSGFEVIVESTSHPLDATYANLNHVLNIDQDGGVSGQIMARGSTGFVGAGGMDISLNREGRVLASASTGNDGVFRFEGVAPGAYTFIATSPGSITTFGVYVFDSDSAPAAGDVQFTVASTGSNTSVVREILNSEIQSVGYTYVPTASEIFVGKEISQVGLSEDGSVSGRVAPLLWEDQGQMFDLSGTSIYLLDDSGVVAETTANADGSYVLSGVSPGVYDFVSFGPAGAAALSIEIVGDESVADNGPATTFVSTKPATKVQDGFDVVLSEPTSGAPSTTVEVIVDIPNAAGGGYGGGGYGGGGSGGGGGFGDFGGLIGLAFAAWALSNIGDNNNNIQQQPVVVPPVVLPPATSPF